MKTLFQHPNFYLAMLHRKRYSIAKQLLAIATVKGDTSRLEEKLQEVNQKIQIMEICKKLRLRVRISSLQKKHATFTSYRAWTPEIEVFRRMLSQHLGDLWMDIHEYTTVDKKTLYVVLVRGIYILVPRKRIARDIAKLRPKLIQEAGRTIILPEGTPIPSSL